MRKLGEGASPPIGEMLKGAGFSERFEGATQDNSLKKARSKFTIIFPSSNLETLTRPPREGEMGGTTSRRGNKVNPTSNTNSKLASAYAITALKELDREG